MKQLHLQVSFAKHQWEADREEQRERRRERERDRKQLQQKFRPQQVSGINIAELRLNDVLVMCLVLT